MNDKKNIKRGEIWLASLEDQNNSSVQGGIRPVLVIQNDMGNKFSTTTLVIPMSSKVHKAKLPTHVVINTRDGLTRESFTMAEQIRVVDQKLLKKRIASLNHNEMKHIDKTIMISMGIGMTNNNRIGDDSKCAANM